MTSIRRLHIICTPKTCLSCLISCSTTPGDMHTSSTHHQNLPELPNFMQHYTWQHAHVIHMLSTYPKLTELPNFMTCLVFICYVVSAGSSSQLVLILSLIFGWTLSVQDVSLISFGRKFCNLFLDQFGFRDCFWYMFCFWLDLPVLGQ